MYVICPVADNASHVIAWVDEGDLAVVLVVAAPSPPCIWTNSRLVRGATLGLVDVWARRHIRMGHRFAVIWEQDLDVLRG